MNFPCMVTWPTAPSDGILIPPYLLPDHSCALPAGHVRGAEPADHACACHDRLPVRDAEPAL